jgi:putative peptidoglycan lipid II flippase
MNIGRTSLRLIPIVILSRGAAFIVPVAVAMWFGADAVSDAWYWALSLPTFSLVLAGAALGTAAVPIMSEAKGDEALSKIYASVLGWVGLLSLGIGVACAAASPWFIKWTSNFTPETQALTTEYCWMLVPFVLLTTLSAAAKAVCEVKGLFLSLTWTPIVRASSVILITWISLDICGPYALPIGLVGGEAVQFFLWVYLIYQKGIRVWPNLNYSKSIQTLGSHILWILGGEALVALNLVIDKVFASQLQEGSVSILEYADRARVIPQTLLHATLAMVAFAAWSKLWAQNKKEATRKAIDQSLHWTLALSSPVIAGMIIGREVLCTLLFERGAFSVSDRHMTATVLGCYLLGVLPNLLAILAVRAHVLLQHFKLIFVLGITSVLINLAFNFALMPVFGLSGIALSTSITVFVIPLIYLYRLMPIINPRQWRVGFISFALSSVVCITFESLGIPETIFASPLWIAAFLCFSILGWAIKNSPSPTLES